MFTGIIEGLGKINAIRSSSLGGTISIISTFDLGKLAIGDSIAVNGTCLTITSIKDRYFDADISPETLKKTVLKNAVIGELVNLEKALKLSSRIDGHLVSGHVDGIITIKRKKIVGNATVITFSIPKNLSQFIIAKGSIAIDGISLTINKCSDISFDVSIIPHTIAITTLHMKQKGDLVNVETDLIGKYIEQFIKRYPKRIKKNNISPSNINMNFLSKNGFI